MTDVIIVASCVAEVEFLAREVPWETGVSNNPVKCWLHYDGDGHPDAIRFRVPKEESTYGQIPVVFGRLPTHDEVWSKTVYGGLPMRLAALANCVWEMEFQGIDPRGRWCRREELEVAGAHLVCYKVSNVTTADKE